MGCMVSGQRWHPSSLQPMLPRPHQVASCCCLYLCKPLRHDGTDMRYIVSSQCLLLSSMHPVHRVFVRYCSACLLCFHNHAAYSIIVSANICLVLHGCIHTFMGCIASWQLVHQSSLHLWQHTLVRCCFAVCWILFNFLHAMQSCLDMSVGSVTLCTKAAWTQCTNVSVEQCPVFL